MGNGIPGAPACSACDCQSRKALDVCVIPVEHGAYPHGLPSHTSEGEMCGCSIRGLYHEDPDISQAQSDMKDFIRCLVKGVQVMLLSVDGDVVASTLSIDRQLTTLLLRRDSPTAKRPIPLEEVREFVVGEAGGAEFNLATHECCVTLVLGSDHGLSFSFQTLEERDAFVFCLTMLAADCRNESQYAKPAPSSAPSV
mmetsp:Transcript_119554/g.338991  ORF Transcript_119554/g.338991 Transcript_119554/m.338991 type:complete len:197 (-) Transcript_119554:65-655(-)